MNKQVLRALYLEKRKTLSNEEFTSRNKAIFKHAIEFLLSHQHKSNCHLFLPILKNKEVNTQPLFEWILKSDKHNAIIPKVEEGRGLSHHKIETGDHLKNNSWGIPEPVVPKPIDTQKIDFVFIPLSCFDRKGNRLGYGGGFYDNFLKGVKKDCLKVGLSLSPPLDNIDYTESHDIPLDMCITHLGTYRF